MECVDFENFLNLDVCKKMENITFKKTNEKFTILVYRKHSNQISSLVIEKVNHDLFHINFDGFNFEFELHNTLHYLHAIQRCINEDFFTYSQRVDVICPIFPCTNIHIFRNKSLVTQLFCIWNSHIIKKQKKNYESLSTTNDGNLE